MNKMKLTGVIGLVVFLILAACSGERGGQRGNRQFHGIENPQADSVIRTAWLAKDYPHLLVIADSLQQTGDLSPQLADILQGDVYLHLSDFAKSKEYYRRVTADHKPQVADIWGRQLLVYTDGLNEAENPARKRLGDDEVLQLMKQTTSLSSRQVVDMLNEAVEKFRDGAEPSDDLTLMCLRVDAVTNPE